MVRLKGSLYILKEQTEINFNSTMVRLKEFGLFFFIFFVRFQFHYGTIKRLMSLFFLVFILSFQFHYGTIKSMNPPAHNRKIPRFQFHYGTIKSLFNNLSICFWMSFQFHYGTIKSFHDKHFKELVSYFNSTMVRLKGNHYKLRIIPNKISIPLWYD